MPSGTITAQTASVALHETCDSGLVILQWVTATEFETGLQLIVRFVTI